MKAFMFGMVVGVIALIWTKSYTYKLKYELKHWVSEFTKQVMSRRLPIMKLIEKEVTVYFRNYKRNLKFQFSRQIHNISLFLN